MIQPRDIRSILLEEGDVPERIIDSAVIGTLMAFVDEVKLQKWYDYKRESLDNQSVCVYCNGTWPSETYVCPTCEEYDGITTYKQAMADGTLTM